jgi:hypothetical protein
MPIERLTNPFDPRVADYRHIAEADLVKSRGLFVAEGRLVVKRLIEDGHRFRSVLVNDTGYRSLEAALIELAQHVPVYICETTDLVEITGYDIHRGCLALVERPTARTSGSLLAEVTQTRKSRRIVVILEGVANADNVGGVFGTPPRSLPTPCSSVRLVAIRCIAKPFARRWPRRCASRSRGLRSGRMTWPSCATVASQLRP